MRERGVLRRHSSNRHRHSTSSTDDRAVARVRSARLRNRGRRGALRSRVGITSVGAGLDPCCTRSLQMLEDASTTSSRRSIYTQDAVPKRKEASPCPALWRGRERSRCAMRARRRCEALRALEQQIKCGCRRDNDAPAASRCLLEDAGASLAYSASTLGLSLKRKELHSVLR